MARYLAYDGGFDAVRPSQRLDAPAGTSRTIREIAALKHSMQHFASQRGKA
jgi:hypothetical protein